jgi:hypothetical protein
MRLPSPDFKIKYFPLMGGEDLITPSISVDPGRALLTHNYELDLQGRYRLIDGYEAFDGQPKPSEASYWILNFDAGSGEISVGDIVDGDGGASGEVLVVVVSSGTWAGTDAAGYLVLFNVTGIFVDDEDLDVSAVKKAEANGVATERGASTDTLDSTYLLAAIEATRADIAAVPGSGNILGVWQYGGVKYAFRNNSGGTAAVMHKSSASGWTECDLGESLPFDTGTAAFVEGETITQGGVTSVCRRVYVTSGTWAGNDAAGYFTITGRAGGNYGAGAITGSGSGAANATGIQTANAFSPSGRFRFINHNFGGNTGTRRMYGCDSVNKAFEWDGTYFIFITTGMSSDVPINISAHRKHLFLAFAGGSVQHSGTGTPYVWSVVLGAAELGIGDEITGFLSLKSVLAIFARNSTHLLYGSSISDWDLKSHSDESGAIEWSTSKIGTGVYLDDRGLTTLSATERYGDFQANVISEYVEPFLKTMLGSVQTSVRVKEKNQYRIFFTNMQCLTMTMKGSKIVGFTRQLYDKLPVCVCSSENSSGEEEIYFGSTDGFVYQLDSGTSFNGNAITAIIKLHFNHLKSPTIVKRIRHITLELDSPIDTYINASIEFDYGKEDGQSGFFELDAPGGIWDIDLWDAFVWSGQSTSSAPIDVDGSAQNFSLTLYSSGEWQLQDVGGRSGLTGAQPHTIQGYTVHYDVRKVQR